MMTAVTTGEVTVMGMATGAIQEKVVDVTLGGKQGCLRLE